MNKLSTQQVAKKLKMSKATLSRYILMGKVPAPEETMAGGMRLRLWAEEDIERLKEALPNAANGRKTRWQRQREKQKARKTQPRAAAVRKQKKK